MIIYLCKKSRNLSLGTSRFMSLVTRVTRDFGIICRFHGIDLHWARSGDMLTDVIILCSLGFLVHSQRPYVDERRG